VLLRAGGEEAAYAARAVERVSAHPLPQRVLIDPAVARLSEPLPATVAADAKILWMLLRGSAPVARCCKMARDVECRADRALATCMRTEPCPKLLVYQRSCEAVH